MYLSYSEVLVVLVWVLSLLIILKQLPFVSKTSFAKRFYKNIGKILRYIIKLKNYLVHVLKFKHKVGNPIGFDISLTKKFKNIKGKFGAKFMVKRLKNRTKFIMTSTAKSFKDFDKASDFKN